MNNSHNKNGLILDMKTMAHDLANNLWAAFNVAFSTIFVGILTALDSFSNHLGIVATLLGIVLTCVLIRVHLQNLKNARLDHELKELQIKKLQRRKDDLQPQDP